MIVDVYIKGERLDLFKDESISVTQGVQDVKDISKLFADFSQSFNVPASKNNNRIFKNFYDATIDNGFDARTRKEGYININTIPFKKGKIRLDGVKLEHGNPASYKITFFGDVIKIKDLLGDDKLTDLDWLSNFDHEYSEDVVKTGLTQGINFTVDGESYPKAVIYPLISYDKQYYYNSDSSDTTATDILTNIAYDSGRTTGVMFDDLKPAIKLSLIVQAIEEKYDDITFSGGFLESQEYKDIYVNINKDTEKLSNGLIVVDSQTVPTPGDISDLFFQVKYFATVTPKAGFEDVEFKIRITLNGEVKRFTNWRTGSGAIFTGGTVTTDATIDISDETEVLFEVITQQDFEFDATGDLRIFNISLGSYPSSFNNNVIDLETNILTQIKDIKVYEFLTSLFKTFNLVVFTDEDDNICIEDLQTWYSSGRIIDVTQYVDTKKKQVDKGVIYNQMDFKFKETDQILSDRFKQDNNRSYGNEELTLYTDDTETERLDGIKLEVESIFENPIYERLTDVSGGLTVVQYCPYFNKEIKPISSGMFMMYANLVDVTSNVLGFNGVGNYTPLNNFVYMPSHSRIINYDSFSLNFYSEFNEYTYAPQTDNIYSRYYKDYVSDIFSVKRRNYKFDAILPLSILNGLKLNDRLIIGNTRYIINKINSNIVNRSDSLELINDIYDAPLASDLITTSVFNPANATFPPQAITASVQYIGVEIQKITIDYLDGTNGWLTIDSYGTDPISTITYSLLENTTNQPIIAQIRIVDGINNPKHVITQEYEFTPSYDFSDYRNSQYIPTL